MKVHAPLVLVGCGHELDASLDEIADAYPARELAIVRVGHFQALAETGLESSHPPSVWQAMAIAPADDLNVMRSTLMLELKLAGYSLGSFISPHARVAPTASVPDHCYISAFALVEAHASLAFNVRIEPRAVIRTRSTIGRSVHVGAAAVIGSGAVIGECTTIGPGAIVDSGVTVGRFCELQVTRRYSQAIGDHTLISPHFEQPARVFALGEDR